MDTKVVYYSLGVMGKGIQIELNRNQTNSKPVRSELIHQWFSFGGYKWFQFGGNFLQFV